MNPEEIVFDVAGLTVGLNTKNILSDISFSLPRGKIWAVIGASGAGKTTLIRSLLGLPRRNGMEAAGKIDFMGKPFSSLSLKEKQRLWGRELGIIFQDSQSSFCPVKTVGSLITQMWKPHESKSEKEIKEICFPLFQRLGLHQEERLWNSYPFELSGGMCQRINIVMAFMMHPSCVLADEPVSALDLSRQKEAARLFKEAAAEGVSMLVATHQVDFARKLADYILVLHKGHVVEANDTERLFEHPEAEFTRELLAARLGERHKEAP